MHASKCVSFYPQYGGNRWLKESIFVFKESDNTVPAENQVSANKHICGIGIGNPRILFLGNSVTLHAPLHAIGWNHNWGMAASDISRDYVHVCMRRIQEKYPAASWRIGQLADWERNFWKDEEVLKDFSDLRNWRPDFVFCTILGANTPAEAIANHDFGAHYQKMLRFFDPESHARLVITTMFWRSPEKDAIIRRVAGETGAVLVEMGDLGDTDAMMAVGLFEHNGVAHHPGDKGMEVIAGRLLEAAKIL